MWKNILLLGVLAYLALVRGLRYQRAGSLPKRYELTSRISLARMTTDDAQSILKELTELEFPTIFGFSIIFALFKGGDHWSGTTMQPYPLTRIAIDIRYTNSFISFGIYR